MVSISVRFQIGKGITVWRFVQVKTTLTTLTEHSVMQRIYGVAAAGDIIFVGNNNY